MKSYAICARCGKDIRICNALDTEINYICYRCRLETLTKTADDIAKLEIRREKIRRKKEYDTNI